MACKWGVILTAYKSWDDPPRMGFQIPRLSMLHDVDQALGGVFLMSTWRMLGCPRKLGSMVRISGL